MTGVSPFLIGVVAGLRSMTAPAAAAWAAWIGWLSLENTWLAVLGFAATPYLLSAAAIGEWIADKLPKAPARKTTGHYYSHHPPPVPCSPRS